MTELKGHLLVASSSLHDPNFVRSVILMLEHTAEGSVGVVLNRPTDKTIEEVAEQVFEEPIPWPKPIHLGGPVPGPLAVLHTTETLSDKEVFPGVYSTMDPDKLRELIRQQTEPSLVVANYAGWGPGQLEAEIDDDAWRFLPARADYVFWAEEGDLWRKISVEYSRAHLRSVLELPEVPEDPSCN
jgi:putative transcriptional regulator